MVAMPPETALTARPASTARRWIELVDVPASVIGVSSSRRVVSLEAKNRPTVAPDLIKSKIPSAIMHLLATKITQHLIETFVRDAKRAHLRSRYHPGNEKILNRTGGDLALFE